MTVVFIAVMATGNFVILKYSIIAPERYQELSQRLSVLARTASADVSLNYDATALSAENPIDSDSAGFNTDVQFIVVGGDALLSSNNPLSNVVPTREGALIYKVQRGDTLSRIAANFGISLNTLLWANENIQKTGLAPGKEIVVLPINGVLHHVQEGETLEGIASQYGISIRRILTANPAFSPSKIETVTSIIIPDAKPIQSGRLTSLTDLPSLPGYFSIPTTGWNWGRLHIYNAVDIANPCGTPIYSSAEGLVVESAKSGWNFGYGNYILIEHPNGTKSRYAHIEKNLVSVGDYVAKGDEIALIGNTGQTHGPTGCHLHFEIYGARNPFAK